jgi:hypothetical protein
LCFERIYYRAQQNTRRAENSSLESPSASPFEVLMKNKFFLGSFVFALSTLTIFSQGVQPSPTPTRPRVIVVGSAPPTGSPTPTPTPKKVVVVTNPPTPTPTPLATPKPPPAPTPFISTTPITSPTPLPIYPNNAPTMSFGQIKSRIAEAKRLMQGRPMPIAMTESELVTNVLRVAFYDAKTAQIDFVVLTKTVFLAKDMYIPLVSANGKNVTVRIIRANGVNTPITIVDDKNQAHVPLVVQYPIERNGMLSEMAFYTSTHPGVVNAEVVNAGKLYVRNTIDIARAKLQEKGIYISPQIADMAERLATVEHIDHQRFRNEYHPNIYNDVFTLYALNEGDTYRYAVSSAGAGGMVQMIPSTYRMVRDRFYNVGLMPDFVAGMRNHVNASQAMLLYMQWTWNDLTANSTVANALESGIATPQDLMAAGYNSNPARLPIYIRRGGAGWRNLIPRETKIYLQIYASLERYVPMTPRSK